MLNPSPHYFVSTSTFLFLHSIPFARRPPRALALPSSPPSTLACRSRARPFSWTYRYSHHSPECRRLCCGWMGNPRQSAQLAAQCTRRPPTMDHLTSRFRRNKKESPITSTLPDPLPTSPTSADAKFALPSLSITTTPATTPPGSSHTSHSLLPKSPLRSSIIFVLLIREHDLQHQCRPMSPAS